jgi:hypothetical protein
MERASLTPMAHTDLDRPRWQWWQGWLPRPKQLPAVSWAILRKSLRFAGRTVRRGAIELVTDLKRDEQGHRARVAIPRIARGLGVQALVLPVALMALSAVLVETRVRPAVEPGAEFATLSPTFCERVTLTASDGTQLSALWVPAARPADVASGRGTGYEPPRLPAVVLVHDHGHDLRQLLPAARGLHAARLNVLLLDTRGAGASQSGARTFGTLEALDVAAAVEHLRSRAVVDGDRIAGWGVGYGGTALVEADLSRSLELVVIQNAVDADQDTRFAPAGTRFDAIRPTARWTFSLFHGGAPRSRPAAPPLRVEEVATPGAALDLVTTSFASTLE